VSSCPDCCFDSLCVDGASPGNLGQQVTAAVNSFSSTVGAQVPHESNFSCQRYCCVDSMRMVAAFCQGGCAREALTGFWFGGGREARCRAAGRCVHGAVFAAVGECAQPHMEVTKP
jgi:hypothetical protein